MISFCAPDPIYEVPVIGMVDHQTSYRILDDDGARAAAGRLAKERG
jgi:hypothetical protein